MAYVVDRVVICDAFREPDQHYQLLPGGKSRLGPDGVRMRPRASSGNGCSCTFEPLQLLQL